MRKPPKSLNNNNYNQGVYNMSTNTKDISFYLYAEILMNKLQSIGNSVEPYTTRASD